MWRPTYVPTNIIVFQPNCRYADVFIVRRQKCKLNRNEMEWSAKNTPKKYRDFKEFFMSVVLIDEKGWLKQQSACSGLSQEFMTNLDTNVEQRFIWVWVSVANVSLI